MAQDGEGARMINQQDALDMLHIALEACREAGIDFRQLHVTQMEDYRLAFVFPESICFDSVHGFIVSETVL